jgi:hypothetical protein
MRKLRVMWEGWAWARFIGRPEVWMRRASEDGLFEEGEL